MQKHLKGLRENEKWGSFTLFSANIDKAVGISNKKYQIFEAIKNLEGSIVQPKTFS